MPVAAPVTPGAPRPAQRAATCWPSSTARSTAACAASSTRWSPRPCRRARSTTRAIPFTGHTEYLARAHRHAARRDDARRRRAARGARHHAPAAFRRARRDHARGPRRHAAHPRRATCASASASRAPRILVAGLNPHAGEVGHLGREEIDVIAPAIDELQARRLRRRRAATPPTRSSRRACSSRATPCSRCTTTRACRC